MKDFLEWLMLMSLLMALTIFAFTILWGDKL